MKVRCETLKSLHWFWIALRSYCDVVSTVADFDPCCMRMDHLETRVLRLQPSRPFLSFRFRHGLLSVAIPASSLDIGPVRPGDDRVEKSLQRGQRSIYATVLATMPAIASTGAMLGCGQKAPVSRGP